MLILSGPAMCRDLGSTRDSASCYTARRYGFSHSGKMSVKVKTVMMTPKQRMIAALEHRQADRLPVTTHHIMQYYLDKYEGGISTPEFFDRYGLDPITWVVKHKPAPGTGDYFDPLQGEPGFLEARRIWSNNWRVESQDVPDDTYKTQRYN